MTTPELSSARRARGSGDVVDSAPAAGDVRAQRPHRDQRAEDVDRHLHHVRPDDRGHSALKGVEQGERGDDGDAENVSRADGEADDDGDGEDANAFRRGAC